MKRFRLVGQSWAGARVEMATSFSERLRGISGVSQGFGLLIKERSVHTFGLDEALWGVGIDRRGTVLSVKPLIPARMFYFSRAAYVVELPEGTSPPDPGDVIWLVR